jgi:hypothetical protein
MGEEALAGSGWRGCGVIWLAEESWEELKLAGCGGWWMSGWRTREGNKEQQLAGRRREGH